MKRVILKQKEGRTLQSGGLWVYDNEIKEEDDILDGEIVEVYNEKGHFFGKGFYNHHSKIRVRLLTRLNEEIDDNFFYKRLLSAYNYRKQVIDISACRLVFGDADMLSGLTIDKYNDVLVFEALSCGIDLIKEKLMLMMKEILENDGHKINAIMERSDAKVRTLEGLDRIKGWLIEGNPEVRIKENGLLLDIDVLNGQKTGYFLDQKNNRKALQSYARDLTVLDCFCNQGGFALNCGLGGAKKVIGIDASSEAIARASHNAEINNLSNTVSFEVQDVFEYLPELNRQNQKFDMIILDPPAFTKSRSSLKNALKGYREINMQALRLVKNGGFLVSSSCSEFLSEEDFRNVITQAGKITHKRLRQVFFNTKAPDHPIIWGSNASYYLKFVLLQVEDER